MYNGFPLPPYAFGFVDFCIILEQKDVIEDNVFKQISAVLKLPVEAFQNFNEKEN